MNDRFLDHYNQKGRGTSQTKKTVGYICERVPQEIVYAAGFLPLRVSGNYDGINKLGDLYLEESYCSFVRALFDEILKGTYNNHELLVIPHSCDAVIRMAKCLWTVEKIEGIKIPAMYWLDLPHHRGLIQWEYCLDRIRDFKKALDELAGRSITDDELRHAIQIYNTNRSLLQEIVDLRQREKPLITGTEALSIIGAGAYMDKELHNRMLHQFLENKNQLQTQKGVRIFLTGSCLDTTTVVEIIESCGGLVVGDDSCLGNRYAEDLIQPDDDPVTAIAHRYFWKSPCPLNAPMKLRLDDFKKRLINARPDAVIFYLYRWCDTNMWDYVKMKEEVDKLGIPHYYFDMQDYHLANPESFRTRVQALIESVQGIHHV